MQGTQLSRHSVGPGRHRLLERSKPDFSDSLAPWKALAPETPQAHRPQVPHTQAEGLDSNLLC